MVRAWRSVAVGNLNSTSFLVALGARREEERLARGEEITAMTPQGSKRNVLNVLKVGLLAAGLLLGVGPAAAWAEGCSLPSGQGVNGWLGGVLVETIEQAEIGLGESGLERHAKATERGTLSGACGSLAALRGRIMVHAESWIPVLDPSVPLLGIGPITGTFHIYPDGQDSGSLKGALAGSLDFTPTQPNDNCQLGCPWVGAQGTWTTTGKNSTGGLFGGLALVPAPCPTGVGLCYYDPTQTLGEALPGWPFAVVPLTDAELIPAPSAKFVITLFQ